MNRQLQHIAIISAALCLLASCKVGKRYARPELNLPDRIEATTEGDSSSVADIPWESLYEDETLRQLIHKALENNKDVNIAAARLKEMMAARRISFADLFPDVKANVYFGKEQLNYGGNNPKLSMAPSSSTRGSSTFGAACAGPTRRLSPSISPR